jgi:hypothetical protein
MRAVTTRICATQFRMRGVPTVASAAATRSHDGRIRFVAHGTLNRLCIRVAVALTQKSLSTPEKYCEKSRTLMGRINFRNIWCDWVEMAERGGRYAVVKAWMDDDGPMRSLVYALLRLLGDMQLRKVQLCNPGG